MTLDSLKQKKRPQTYARYFFYMLYNAITHCLFSVRQNIRVLYTSVCPQARGHVPVGADTAQKGASCYLPKTQPGLQLILVIDILLAAIKTLRGCD